MWQPATDPGKGREGHLEENIRPHCGLKKLIQTNSSTSSKEKSPVERCTSMNDLILTGVDPQSLLLEQVQLEENRWERASDRSPSGHFLYGVGGCPSSSALASILLVWTDNTVRRLLKVSCNNDKTKHFFFSKEQRYYFYTLYILTFVSNFFLSSSVY